MARSTNSKAARTVIFRYILDSVQDTECEGMNDSDKAAYLWGRFESEYNYSENKRRIPNLQARVAEWLSGLAIGIAYTNADIVTLAEQWQDCKLSDKQAARVIDNYFNFMAFKVMQLCKAHGISDHWHFWQGAQFMLSDESNKELRAFDTIDDCVNWLWLNGEKQAARAVNALKESE